MRAADGCSEHRSSFRSPLPERTNCVWVGVPGDPLPGWILRRLSDFRVDDDELSKRNKTENHRDYHKLCCQLNKCFFVVYAESRKIIFQHDITTTYLPTVLMWVILERRACDKGTRYILFGNVILGSRNKKERSEQGEKGEKNPSKTR